MLFTLVIVEFALCTAESSAVSFPIFSFIDGDIALLFLRGGACSGTLKKIFESPLSLVMLSSREKNESDYELFLSSFSVHDERVIPLQ
jgi:hypothetical protein